MMLFSSCKPKFEPEEISKGEMDPTRFVMIGGGQVAGYMNDGLYFEGQENSLPNILAKQFGSSNILNNARATILALTKLNEKIELGKYQSTRKQIFYDKVMRKYKNVRA